jgi:protocatechuate 3,4-dioxygenase beta subunit
VKLLIIVFSVFCVVLIPRAHAIQANSSQQNAKPSIRGKVLQEPDGQPIRKATVQLIGQKGPTGAQHTAVSDAEGQFVIEDVQPGQYHVVVEHPGFVQAGAGQLKTIWVQPSSGRNDLILHMQAAAVITGKIVDVDGDPMRYVRVSATRAGTLGAGWYPNNFSGGTTNDLGEFRISGLRAGRYKVTASPLQGPRASNPKGGSDGSEQSIYITTYYPSVSEESQALAVEVHSGSETRINFGLLTGRAYRVSGSVTGIPNKGAMVQVLLQGRGSASSHVVQEGFDEGGRFEFMHVLPGSYVPMLIVYTIDDGQQAMQMLRLGQPIEVSNAPVDGLRLQPEVGGQVRGKFRADAGQKLDWTQLTVRLAAVEEPGAAEAWRGMGIPGNSRVNSDGTFELKNVPGGDYQLIVGSQSKDFRGYFTKSINLGGRDVADSGFPVSPEPYLDVLISAKGASIAGTVLDGNGQPMANATVVGVPSGEHRTRPDLYQQETSDESGHFSLRGLNPGTYTVLAFEELQEDFRQSEFLKTYETRGEIVQLDEGARKSVVLKLIPYEN